MFNPTQVPRDMPLMAMLSLMGTAVVGWDTTNCTLNFEVFECGTREQAKEFYEEGCRLLDAASEG